jgi:hypothetical protein
MTSQVPFDALGPVDFIPQAVVRQSVDYFTRRLGYKFESDTDDLDEYESAFFKLSNGTPFALVHYRGNPEDTTTIYFSRETKGDEIPSVVEAILRDFDLSSVLITWINELR